MNQDLALKVLGRIMNWSDDRARDEFRWLRLMARLKYDGYHDFHAGMRFAESLVTWLQQFENPEERETAYAFVRGSPVPPDQAPHAAAVAAFAEAKAFLCSREAQQMRESDLERELHRRGQELIRKLLQGHRDRCSPEESAGPVEGADDVERSQRRLHERHPDTTSTTTFGTVQVACLSGSRLSVAPRCNSTSRPPPCAASTSRCGTPHRPRGRVRRERRPILQFSSPAWRMAARDRRVGWDDRTRARNLQRAWSTTAGSCCCRGSG